MNIQADDSASQMNQRQNEMQNMRNNPFTSNLENAKMLAQLTKERVNNLNISSNDNVVERQPLES